MIISLVNSKGGVGKSTLAGNLAGWLADHGQSVILADCDTQQSSSEWIVEALPDIQIVRLANADAVLDELPVLAQEADFVIADGPGSQTETSRALLMWADLAIMPCKASMFEARALDKNTAFVRQAQAIRKGPPEVIAVLSMVGREYRLTRDMRDAASALGLQIAETPITLRQAYADAPGQGTFVWNMGYHAKGAAEEINRLFAELFPDIAERDGNIRRGKSNNQKTAEHESRRVTNIYGRTTHIISTGSFSRSHESGSRPGLCHAGTTGNASR